MNRQRLFLIAGAMAGCGLVLIAIGHAVAGPSKTPPTHQGELHQIVRPLDGQFDAVRKGGGSSGGLPGFLDFAETPRRPGNLVERIGVVGRSVGGLPVRLRQLGDPAISGRVLIVGCIHGDECAGSGLVPLSNGCPDPRVNAFVVPNLNPDGSARGSRVNGRGVDLNRNFPSSWRPIGRRGDPQYAGPHPFSEPETRLAARLVNGIRPRVTIWFHQYRAPRPLVRAWGGSVGWARRLATLSDLPFKVLPWPHGTAPNWQNHRFPGSSSFVVELPPGDLRRGLANRLTTGLDRLAREVGQD